MYVAGFRLARRGRAQSVKGAPSCLAVPPSRLMRLIATLGLERPLGGPLFLAEGRVGGVLLSREVAGDGEAGEEA